MSRLLLLGTPGCGSVIVEMALALAGMPYDHEVVDYAADSPTRARLLEVNPLGQVPALQLPGGAVLTESAAMLHWIQDEVPSAPLIPPPGDPRRPGFYRWLFFLVAAVYPTYTYGDDAKKWVDGDEAAGKALREATDGHRKRLLLQLEGACSAPHFLGERFSAIDLYVVAMSHWRPGTKWWESNVPRLLAATRSAMKKAEVARLVARDFG